jgi:integrase
MGSLFLRGKTWWIKYYHNGKSFRESSRSTKQMVAKKLLARKEGEIAQGKLPGFWFDRVTFDELAQDFLRDYEINARKSLNRAKQCLVHLMAEFGGMTVVNITTPLIQNVYIPNRKKWTCRRCNEKFHIGGETTCPMCGNTLLLKGASNATINRELSALKRILNLGAQQTPAKVNRLPHIPMLKENNVRQGFFEHDQFLALRDQLPEYLKSFVTFGYKIGWRVQEIASLTWGHVDLKNGIVTLKAGEAKNQEARTVYLDQELKRAFEQQWSLRRRSEKIIPYVFPNRNGTGKIGNFRRTWNTACRTIGMGYGYKLQGSYVEKWKGRLPPGPIFHDLRRTAVRNMVRAGVPERVAMMVSGHKTRSVFDRYNIVNDSDLKMATAKQEKYLDNQTGTNSGTIAQFGKKKAPFGDPWRL